MMITGIDVNGNIRLVSESNDPRSIPNEWNGMALTPKLLSAEQELALKAIGGPAAFAGDVIVAVAVPVNVVGNISGIELNNPITHRAEREKALTDDFIMRALREKINALDAEVAALAGRAAAPLPEIPVSHGLRAVKAVDDAIKAERAKL